MPGSSSELLGFDHLMVDLRKLGTTSCQHRTRNIARHVATHSTSSWVASTHASPARCAHISPTALCNTQAISVGHTAHSDTQVQQPVTSWTVLSTTHHHLQHPHFIWLNLLTIIPDVFQDLNKNLNKITFMSCDIRDFER